MPLILLGHELFFDRDSPLGIDFDRTAEFVTRIASVGSYRYLFVARREPSDLRCDVSVYYQRLLDLKVPFSAKFIVNPLNPNHWVDLNNLLRVADLGYAPELFSSPLIIQKAKCTSIDPAGVIECLLECVASAKPFTHDLFISTLSRKLLS